MRNFAITYAGDAVSMGFTDDEVGVFPATETMARSIVVPAWVVDDLVVDGVVVGDLRARAEEWVGGNTMRYQVRRNDSGIVLAAVSTLADAHDLFAAWDEEPGQYAHVYDTSRW